MAKYTSKWTSLAEQPYHHYLIAKGLYHSPHQLTYFDSTSTACNTLAGDCPTCILDIPCLMATTLATQEQKEFPRNIRDSLVSPWCLGYWNFYDSLISIGRQIIVTAKTALGLTLRPMLNQAVCENW